MSIVQIEVKLARQVSIVNYYPKNNSVALQSSFEGKTRRGLRGYLIGKLVAEFVGQQDWPGRPAKIASFIPQSIRARRHCRVVKVVSKGL